MSLDEVAEPWLLKPWPLERIEGSVASGVLIQAATPPTGILRTR
jgi:hypothetical protein